MRLVANPGSRPPRAGIGVVTDGEMRPADFFTAQFYRDLTRFAAAAARPASEGPGHDQQQRFEVLEPITASGGLGTVAEFEYARRQTASIPDRVGVAWAFVPILNAEMRELQAAGATFIQGRQPTSPRSSNAEGVTVRRAAHLCFGNYMGRQLTKRNAPTGRSDQVLRFDVDELVLEFANRELAELEIAGELAGQRYLAAGVVDVKDSFIETPDDVAERIERFLAYLPVALERLGRQARLRLQADVPSGCPGEARRAHGRPRPRPRKTGERSQPRP